MMFAGGQAASKAFRPELVGLNSYSLATALYIRER